MINKLTKKQEAKIAVYRAEWLEKVLSTERLDKAKTEQLCKWLYAEFLSEHSGEPQVFIAKSPLEGLRIVNEMKAGGIGTKVDKLTFEYYKSPSYWWSGYYCFYDYILGELMPEKQKDFELFYKVKEFSQNIPIIWTFSGFCIVVERPIEIHWDGRDFSTTRVLHNPNGPAVLYEDGYALYALNGIRMTKEQVMTPASDINVIDVMKEPNVEIRRELLRKVGLERFVKDFKGEVLDTLETVVNNKKIVYQLIEIEVEPGNKTKVLKMDNPSINASHVEGVEDTCDTVKKALAWRNGFDTYVAPQQLT